MKQLIYWLIGEKTGRTIAGMWHWLWGIPVESGGKVALEVAKESLESMQRSVAQLTESVATVVAAYDSVKAEYDLKLAQKNEAEQQANLAIEQGNDDAAKLAISRVITFEILLSTIKAKVEQSEKVVTIAKQKLQQEMQKLEIQKLEMQHLKSLHKINESLAKITDFDSSLNMQSAQEQFTDAHDAIQNRNYKVNALVDLTDNPTEQLQNDLDRMTLDAKVNERLKQLKKVE